MVLAKNDAERFKSLANEIQTTLDVYMMQLDEIYLKISHLWTPIPSTKIL
jgi:hypothetical protein